MIILPILMYLGIDRKIIDIYVLLISSELFITSTEILKEMYEFFNCLNNDGDGSDDGDDSDDDGGDDNTRDFVDTVCAYLYMIIL